MEVQLDVVYDGNGAAAYGAPSLPSAWMGAEAGRALTAMSPNEAVRAQIRVMMAEGSGSAPEVDALANAVINLVLQAMGVEPSEVGDGLAAVGPEEHRASTRDAVAVRAATVVERLEPLAAVAEAAARYRKAARKGKGEKKARRELFEAVAAWKESGGDLLH
jgi:hypothetical protein